MRQFLAVALNVIVGKFWHLSDAKFHLFDGNWSGVFERQLRTLPMSYLFVCFSSCSRRLLYVVVPDWPNVMISGKIPQLVIHINEEKVCLYARRELKLGLFHLFTPWLMWTHIVIQLLLFMLFACYHSKS